MTLVICGLNCKLLQQLVKYWVMKQCGPHLATLAEAYNVKAWDTRKQVSSIMVGITSYKALLAFIPGLTPYRYTQAGLHRLQHSRTVPAPKKEAPR